MRDLMAQPAARGEIERRLIAEVHGHNPASNDDNPSAGPGTSRSLFRFHRSGWHPRRPSQPLDASQEMRPPRKPRRVNKYHRNSARPISIPSPGQTPYYWHRSAPGPAPQSTTLTGPNT